MTSKKKILKRTGQSLRTKRNSSKQGGYHDVSQQYLKDPNKKSLKSSRCQYNLVPRSFKNNKNPRKRTLKGGHPKEEKIGFGKTNSEYFSKKLKGTSKTLGRMKSKARGMVEGTIKAPQLMYRMNDVGSIYGFMPTSTEVKGKNLASRFGGKPLFCKDLYMNLKANLLLLSSVDHITLAKMLLVNPTDIADYTRAYEHIKKKGASLNVVSDPAIFEKQNYMGMRTAQRLKSLKDEMKLITKDSIVSENPLLKGQIRSTKKGKPISYKPFNPEKEIKKILQPDFEKYKADIFDDGSARRAQKSTDSGEENLSHIEHLQKKDN